MYGKTDLTAQEKGADAIPFELGYLLYRARKNGSTLGSVVLYREPVPRTQLVALVLGLLAWSGIFYVFI
jgi:hypothetical protein